MKRSKIQELFEWKNKPNRKPLIVQGARQVGKTWLLNEFGRTAYANVAYVNCYDNPRMAALFQGAPDVATVIAGLKAECRVEINPADTLIILDEIQDVPRALAYLKIFCEQAAQYHVAAAGSMLGVAMHAGISFPVGKVDFVDLAPLSFGEFLLAAGEPQLADMRKAAPSALTAAFRERFVSLLKTYFFTGGMPEVVAAFCANRSWKEARDIQREILLAYELDFSKHAGRDSIARIRGAWRSLPAQLAKENKKFVYGVVREGARAKEYENALLWLEDAGLIRRVRRVTAPRVPLASYADAAVFKLYHLDIGLLSAMAGLDEKTLLEGSAIFTEFKGALTEQFAFQELSQTFDDCRYYWTREKSEAEVDCLLQHGGDIFPVEIKAGENLRSKSLRSYAQTYAPKKAIRLSLSDYRDEGWLLNLPLWLASKLKNFLPA